MKSTVKLYAWRIAVVLLVFGYFSMMWYIGSCDLGELAWEETFWGQVHRFVAEGGELLAHFSPIICYFLAYRLRHKRWLSLLMTALPALFALPMALTLGWTPVW